MIVMEEKERTDGDGVIEMSKYSILLIYVVGNEGINN